MKIHCVKAKPSTHYWFLATLKTIFKQMYYGIFYLISFLSLKQRFLIHD